MPKLENWSFGSTAPSAYTAPELYRNCLRGVVTSHPKIKDGSEITTSEVLMLNTREKIANTRNSFYRLGQPDPKWVEWMTTEGYKIEDFDFDRS